MAKFSSAHWKGTKGTKKKSDGNVTSLVTSYLTIIIFRRTNSACVSKKSQNDIPSIHQLQSNYVFEKQFNLSNKLREGIT
jgi:hypothetical protein